jgi:hypothetical protein
MSLEASEDFHATGELGIGDVELVYRVESKEERKVIHLSMTANRTLHLVQIELLLYQLAHLLAVHSGTLDELIQAKRREWV